MAASAERVFHNHVHIPDISRVTVTNSQLLIVSILQTVSVLIFER